MNTLKCWVKRFYWADEKKADNPCELVLIHGLQDGLTPKQIVEAVVHEYEKDR